MDNKHLEPSFIHYDPVWGKGQNGNKSLKSIRVKRFKQERGYAVIDEKYSSSFKVMLPEIIKFFETWGATRTRF